MFVVPLLTVWACNFYILIVMVAKVFIEWKNPGDCLRSLAIFKDTARWLDTMVIILTRAVFWSMTKSPQMMPQISQCRQR